MRIVFISDTHGHFPELPDGDVLVHAGDGTMMGTESEVNKLDEWLGTLPFENTIYVPGNHDFAFEYKSRPPSMWLKNALVLVNRGVSVRGAKIWGSPYTPVFGNWAFMRSEEKLAEFWELVPGETDILVTHGPPRGILDKTVAGLSVGSRSLLMKVKEATPRFHVFGHIHEAAGEHYNRGTRFINVSVCNEFYRLVNQPVVVDIGV